VPEQLAGCLGPVKDGRGIAQLPAAGRSSVREHSLRGHSFATWQRRRAR